MRTQHVNDDDWELMSDALKASEDIINVKESQTGFYLKLLTERQSKAFSKAI